MANKGLFKLESFTYPPSSFSEKLILVDTLNQVLVSVIAGLSLSKMKEQFPSVKNHVRIMTNTAVTIGEGVMAITPDESCPEPVVDNIKQLLSKCGCLEVKGSHKIIKSQFQFLNSFRQVIFL